MTTEKQLPASLLDALHTFEDSREGREVVLKVFLRSRVHVLLDRPWDGRSLPTTETRLLFVSDGENKEQPMLAVFTGREQAETVAGTMGDYQHPVEVDAQWALLAVPPNIGVRINPNSEPSFRILPELTLELRKLAEQNLARRRTGQGASQP
jgi:hypothetical protein